MSLCRGRAAKAGAFARGSFMSCGEKAKSSIPDAPARTGFTLVEVIVVLVILAILAAIAIPALTGYIDKAEDEKYITEARDRAQAVRAIFNEKYAEGEFDSNDTAKIHIEEGMSTWNSSYTKRFSAGLSIGGYTDVMKEAAALAGVTWTASSNRAGYWFLDLIGPRSSTMLNAGGFMYGFFPEGNVAAQGKPAIYVTYGLPAVEKVRNELSASFLNKLKAVEYDPNAGYNVYHIIRS
jgi:prepilin-type N-terminal cleavage/methylation domain-containing protein